MRTEKEFKEERFFGLQAFDTAGEAFNVMAGIWGGINSESQPELLIATEDYFKKAILLRAIKIYIEYKAGGISLKDCNQALAIGEDITDYLLDFDFILYSESSKRFYTSRMGMKDDGVTEWNERQWGYFTELYKAYSFGEIVEKAKALVDPYYTDGPQGEPGEIYTDIANEQGLLLI